MFYRDEVVNDYFYWLVGIISNGKEQSYTKLLMDIKHSEGDNQPVVRRLSFDFEEFTSDRLTSILKDVVQEFADKLNMKMINNITE